MVTVQFQCISIIVTDECVAAGNCQACRDLDECTETPDDVTCQANEVCENRINASCACACAAGYERDSHGICSNINECQGDHGCEHECVDTEGSYKCVCSDGYQNDEAGKCVDINECDLDTDNCEQICENIDGSFQCSCNEDYELEVGVQFTLSFSFSFSKFSGKNYYYTYILTSF